MINAHINRIGVFLSILMLCSCTSKDNHIKQKDISLKERSHLVNLSESEIESANINCKDILEGETIDVEFKYTNTSQEAFIIYDVKTWCTCSYANYDKKPLQPSSVGILTIRFDSSGRVGLNHRNIVVITNSKKKYYKLSFKVKVLKNHTV